MIGSGQHVMLELWHNGRLVHRGILAPGEETSQRFSDGPQMVSAFTLRRLTKDEANAIPAEPPEAV